MAQPAADALIKRIYPVSSVTQLARPPLPDLSLLDHLEKTRQTTRSFFYQLVKTGVDAYHATIVSQALARLMCEQIPPNALQRQSVLFCWDAVVAAGLVGGSPAQLEFCCPRLSA